MDNADCLKNLTENIVKKQVDSIESIKNLCQAVDSVSSDISNLINSLLMVGNRQFTENRIQDDDSLLGDEQLANDHNQQMKHRAHDSQQSLELSLGSILNEALSLLPQRDLVEGTHDYSEAVSDDVQEEPQLEDVSDEPLDQCIGEAEAAVQVPHDPLAMLRQELENKHGFAKRESRDLVGASDTHVKDISCYSNMSAMNDTKSPPDAKDDTSNSTDNSASMHRSTSGIGTRDTPLENNQRANDNPESSGSMKDDDMGDSRSKRVKPNIDRDRVANILKKYSLYDDDEDDDEEDESSD